MYEYWHKQEPGIPLFPDIAWQKPEQKALAGKLCIIGGNAHGFAAVAQAYKDALNAGAGECRAVLPDALKRAINPPMTDTIFVQTNISGGFSKDALAQLKAAAAWADCLLLIGDAGRNSETAIVYEQLLTAFPEKTTIVTRDAIDLLRASWSEMLERQPTVLVASFAQLQKIFQSVYYPRTLLFSVQLASLVETLHKFTITYPATIVVFHQNQLLVAKEGEVTSTPWDNPMLIWRGTVAAHCATYAMQHPRHIFQAIATSLAHLDIKT